MEKINIAEILKDCPKKTKLYSPLCGEYYFDSLNMGTIICKKRNEQDIAFTSEGYYMLPVFNDCECLLFPSKENRDWSKFQRPFKDGDIVVAEDDESLQLFLLKHLTYSEDDNSYDGYCYFGWDFHCNELFEKGKWGFNRHATEEEKAKLFDAIKKHGYKWNSETKTLEELIKPKFKVGDRIKHIVGREEVATVVSVEDLHYNLDSKVGTSSFSISLQREWELVPNKFDITTLKPFESRVLTRDDGYSIWQPNVWGLYDKEHRFPYVTTGNRYRYCIPYEGNEHLIGKTDDCDEYFKNW